MCCGVVGCAWRMRVADATHAGEAVTRLLWKYLARRDAEEGRQANQKEIQILLEALGLPLLEKRQIFLTNNSHHRVKPYLIGWCHDAVYCWLFWRSDARLWKNNLELISTILWEDENKVSTFPRENGWNIRGYLRFQRGKILADKEKIDAFGLKSRLTYCRRNDDVNCYGTIRNENFWLWVWSKSNWTIDIHCGFC